MKKLKMIYTGPVEVEVKGVGKIKPNPDGKPVEVDVPDYLMNLARDPHFALSGNLPPGSEPDKREKKKSEPVGKKEEPVPVREKKTGGKE